MNVVTRGKSKVVFQDNHLLEWCYNENKIIEFYAEAICEDGSIIDSRLSTCIEVTEKEEQMTLNFKYGDFVLKEIIEIQEDECISVQCELENTSGKQIHMRQVKPIIAKAPDSNSPAFLRSLWTKMLLVPYDNTMWVRYEAVPLRPGRISYDVTAVLNEGTREGIVIGAADFDLWKNAIICSGSDARVMEVVCGIADRGTHDACLHGIVRGKKIISSKFFVLYGKDYRELLESYADKIKANQPPLQWQEGVPFGWNSWSGLAFRLNADYYKEAGKFLREELMLEGYENRGTTYINFDAGWNSIQEEGIKHLVEQLHENGQKAGIYAAPFAWFGRDGEEEILGVTGHCYKEILLKDEKNNFLPRVDGAIPMDVTHPIWKEHMRYQLRKFVEWGFDYVKLDFLSHGGMEGMHYNSECMTGRQAIIEGYSLITEELSPNRIGRPFFISLSIAPLFPHGFGHARRFSCDAFGLAEDTEYVLNALTYAWWQSGRLYAYNDPDHISLYRSFCADRASLLGEARARYTASVISGTVMMLSDDYGMGNLEDEAVNKAKERARKLVSSREINRIAQLGRSFRPVYVAGTSASKVYSLEYEDEYYIAAFHWQPEKEEMELDLKAMGIEGVECARELWRKEKVEVKNHKIKWLFEGCDSIILKIEKKA